MIRHMKMQDANPHDLTHFPSSPRQTPGEAGPERFPENHGFSIILPGLTPKLSLKARWKAE